MYVIRLYPYVFSDIEGNKVFLFDTLHKKYISLHFSGEIKQKNKLTFLVNDTKINNKNIYIIQTCYYGIVDKTNDSDEMFLEDSISAVQKYFDSFFSKPASRNYITDYLITEIKIELFDKKANDNIMSENTIGSLITILPFLQNVNNIIVTVNSKCLAKYHSVLKKILRRETSVKIIIDIQELKKDHKTIFKWFEPKIIYIRVCNIDNFSMETFKYLKSTYPNTNFIFEVNSRKEFELITGSDSLPKSNISFEINPNTNETEKRILLRYQLSDLLDSSLSVVNMIKNEWINQLFWGVLTINHNGDIYSNLYMKIGNLKDWDAIKFEKLVQNDSIWRYTRKKHPKCTRCMFRNICPPVSIYESNKVYCKNIKKEIFL